jgi:hypothetical protein
MREKNTQMLRHGWNGSMQILVPRIESAQHLFIPSESRSFWERLRLWVVFG